MRIVPTPEESAEAILTIFKVMGFRSGAALQKDQVQMQFNINGGNIAGFSAGLQFGVDNGWLKLPSEVTIELTDAGFAECEKANEGTPKNSN